ncbi:MAG: ATP-binding protein, partial [Gammaproteobacteria bacterium]|nr:ATP-binding protein [Gammaproteobacteria bacterium]
MKRLFIKKLIEWKDAEIRKPLIVKGIRQSGKTYSITAFGKNHFPNMHYINFEKDGRFAKIFEADFNPIRIIDELSFALDTAINITTDLLFFDEIQACPKALTSLKYFQEDMPELALCSAGSLLGVHLSTESFPVGKVDLLKVSPMSFEEFLMALDDNKSIEFLCNISIQSTIPEIIHTHIWQQLKLYFIVGGLPEVVQTFKNNQTNLYTALELVRKKQTELILAYNADMAKHSGKVNAMHLDRLWKAIPAQLAREQDGSATKFKFKGIIPGINRYSRLAGAIDWLEAAGLVIKTHIVNSGNLPFAAYSKENAFKLYVADVGLLGALSELTPQTILAYDYGTYKGYFAENFIAQEFQCSGVANLYSWQEGRYEIEFLRDIQGQVIPIEVKSGWVTKTHSLNIFAEKYKSSYKT